MTAIRAADFDRIAAKMRQCSIIAMAARESAPSGRRFPQPAPVRSGEQIRPIDSRSHQAKTREADPVGLEGRMASSRARSP
jgi:hypothetical protein